MVALGLDRRRQAEHPGLGDRGDRRHAADAGEALGQGPGLVEHHRVGPRQSLECVPAADEDPQGRGAAGPHHHGDRGGQAHGARAGHEQDRHRAQHRRPEVPVQEPPRQERDRGGHEHGRDEDAADAVGQPLESEACPSGRPPPGAACRASTDSAAIVVTRTTSDPAPFLVPPVTLLSGPWSTGSGSPVSIDSSTADHPLTTVPSRGMASLGRTRTNAPTGTLSGATRCPSTSSGPDTTRAVGGRRAINECIAADARPRARASMYRPVTRIATMRGAMTPCRRGRELASPSDVHVPAAQGDRLHRADGERRQRPDGDQRVHAGGAVAQQAGAGTQERPAARELDDDGEAEDDPTRHGILGREQRHPQRQEGRGPGDRGADAPMIGVRVRTRHVVDVGR